MSFRELRNFTETMKVLGYPRLISIANFRTPNFPLVAEILVWLVKRFDSDSDITFEHNTEEERILLIRSVAEFMALNTNVKLNTKKLYQADGYAVQELLKITNLLQEAQNHGSKSINQNDNRKIIEFNISDEINELKSTRQLASLLTVNGATLFDLLGREVELRDIRNNKAGRQFDTAEIETALKDVIENMRKEIEDTKKQIDNVKDTEQSLDTRIERRRSELERNQKRLQTLRKVRPAFMEEYEKLEAELRILYDDYLQKFRYLSYLEHLHEDAAKAEQERIEKRQAETKRKLEQLRSEDVSFESMIEGNDLVFGASLQESRLTLGDVEKQNMEKTIQQGAHTKTDTEKTSRTQMSQRRIYGSMSGRQRGTILESNDSAGSLDSDSDLLIDGDLDDDDDEDDDDLLNSVRGTDIGNFDRKVAQDKRSVSKVDHSDEDF
ncbi:clusterin-associated protein 1-like [Vespa mandarinia]|uniref:clusterin-associated protein 1-like n=1 Tax=Vespa mandarinia TaxID=7446 RepID=UPI0016104B5E|nr:clusterin-associated protein 1-like [Vespa mandarinia]